MNEERLSTDRPDGSTSSDPPADQPAESPANEPTASAATDGGPEAHASDPVEALVEELEPVAEAAAAAGADEVDTAFAEHLDPETLAFGAPKPQAIVCQWCNGPLETDALEVCPHCGSRLKPTDDDLVVPGVTTLSAEAARALELVEIQRNREAAKTGQAMYTTPSLASAAAVVPAPDEATVEAANRPPDDQVRRLMLEMELEARQARAMAAARADIEEMIVADAAPGAASEAVEPSVEAAAGSDATTEGGAPDAGQPDAAAAEAATAGPEPTA
jgi:hypothetical protein